ncbi:GTPase HflX [Lentilitoribacter sp. Alg239-R112]|uniref:GTPase HflX n=1 Tax=Lentilitoribacter sp. Alg239-R112 TaxID=2305987 RepID=UPI001FCE6F8A|nr:GTPase HflX [Lentilitoribacter sp. Alg239-R112]
MRRRSDPKQVSLGTEVMRDGEARKDEAIGLAHAIDLNVVLSLTVTLPKAKASTLLGSGKVDEVASLIKQYEAELVIVDHALSPIQQRNLEEAWHCKVIDRTGLILEIFGKRASTKEGVLQVELAHLNYQKGRLVRSWTHLERQRGGGGFMGGPGETQIESDRRMLQSRISSLERELEQVRRTRQLHRSKRQKVPHPIVALVGYTNAGKSTLFNKITGADVLAHDMLFATLDPTLRKMSLPLGRSVILSDTVGFISDLPTHLVAAFRATLEEVLEADLILHVRDMTDPDHEIQANDVMQILSTLGLKDKENANIIEVWNKLDDLEPEIADQFREKADGHEKAIGVSALTGQGIGELLNLIEKELSGRITERTIELKPAQMRILPWIYENTKVLARKDQEDGSVQLDIEVTEHDAEELLNRHQVHFL